MFDHFTIAGPDNTYRGIYPNYRQAQFNVRSADERAVACSRDGRLQPMKMSDGTVVDMGTIYNPTMPSTPAVLPAASAPGLQYSGTGHAGEVSEVALERVQRHEVHMAQFGIVAPPPVFAPGSLTYKDAASENFLISHQDHSRKIFVTEGLAAIQSRVESECRRDSTVAMRSLRMSEDGRLYRLQPDGTRPPLGAFRLLELNGLRQICSRAPEHFPRAAEFLAQLPPKIRADAFNAQVEKVPETIQIRLRDRVGPSGRSIFAAVGPEYGAFDADRICAALQSPFQEIQAEYGDQAPRGDCVYRPHNATVQIDAVWHADTIVDAGAGDIFKAGIRFRSSDAGGGSVQADLVVWRNRCLNFIIVGMGQNSILRQVHRGKVEGLTVNLQSAAHQVRKFMDGFASDWGLLRKTAVAGVRIYGESYPDVPTALRALVDQKKLDGITAASVATEALLTAWKEEPGNTLADLINAVTRYAHAGSRNPDRQDKLERAAGELVPVLVRAASSSY